MEKAYDVTAIGELLIDFTENGLSSQGNPLLEANPGGAPCNVLAMLNNLGKKTGFIGKVGDDQFGRTLRDTLVELGIGTDNLLLDKVVHTTLAFVHTAADGDRDFSFYRKPGADMMLTEDEVREDLIAKSRILHFGTLSLTDEPVRSATKKALEYAKKHDVMVTFDPNLRPPLWNNLQDAKEQIWFGLSKCAACGTALTSRLSALPWARKAARLITATISPLRRRALSRSTPLRPRVREIPSAQAC